MNIRFATCNRKTALGFLQKLYPGETIEDIGLTKAVLDLVEKDIIRIPDPSMHGQRVAIYPSKNWNELNKKEYTNTLTKFHEKFNG